MNKQTIETLLHAQLLETDQAELSIKESGLVKDLLKIIIEEHLKEHLKKSFSKVKNEVIEAITEDQNIIEKLKFLNDDIILDFISSFGKLEIKETEKSFISDIWKLKGKKPFLPLFNP